MLACALLSALAAAGPSQDGLAAVRSVLAHTEGASTCREDLLVRRLVALGSPVAPALLALVTGEAIEELLADTGPESWLCAPDRVGELALQALAELPLVPVRACLRAASSARPEREVRVAALRVLGLQGSADGLTLLFELLTESAEEIELRTVRAPAQEALLAILRTDGHSARVLQPLLRNAPLAQQRLACEALARCGRPEVGSLLLGLVGRDAELDVAVLDGLAGMAERYPWRAAPETTSRLRACLERPEARLRAGAALALGKLRDAESAPALIARLGDADPTVARTALWALRESSGQARLETRDQWQDWLLGERAWWQDEGRARLAGLAPGDSGRLADTLRVLMQHPLGREQVGNALIEQLAEFEPGAKVLVCATLAQLGVRKAVPDLVELLFEADQDVRAAAWSALRLLTGEDLPAEPRLWEEYAFG